MFQMHSGSATWHLKYGNQHKISVPGFAFTIAVMSGSAMLIVTSQRQKRQSYYFNNVFVPQDLRVGLGYK